jgi:uncharacterized membrane protein HdeD (DUF308 family)
MKMVNHSSTDPADVIARLGRYWVWILAFGVITLLAGVAALAWPGATILVLAILLGAQLVVTGIFRFVAALASDDLTGGTRALLALLGVLSFAVGLYALRHVLLTIVALALLLGIFWVVNGAIEIFAALSHREMPARGWTAATGILSIIAGVIALMIPGISLVVLAVVMGAWLVIFGIMEISAAFQVRRRAHHVIDSDLAHAL